PDSFTAEERLAVPISVAQNEATNTCHRPRVVTAPAPRSDQWQTVHRAGLAVTHGPFVVAHADGSHDALAQQGADVLVRRVSQGGGDAPRQHGDAGVAVVEPLARVE